jgi:hypothetical protein
MEEPNDNDNLLHEIDTITEIFHIQKYIKKNQEEHLMAFLTTANEQSIPKLTRSDTYCGPKLDHSVDVMKIERVNDCTIKRANIRQPLINVSESTNPTGLAIDVPNTPRTLITVSSDKHEHA